MTPISVFSTIQGTCLSIIITFVAVDLSHLAPYLESDITTYPNNEKINEGKETANFLYKYTYITEFKETVQQTI